MKKNISKNINKNVNKNVNVMCVICVLFLVLGLFGASPGLAAGDDAAGQLEAQMEKLRPLIGQWDTRSFFPGFGTPVPGHLEYRFVLGKQWMNIHFVGQHPTRPHWEAHVMVTYDTAKKKYISYSFFDRNGPTLMTGDWVSASTFRLATTDEKGALTYAIDYSPRPDGTVYQENWRPTEKGEKQIVLKTEYTRIVDADGKTEK